MSPETVPTTSEFVAMIQGFLRETFASPPVVLIQGVKVDDDWWTVPVVSNMEESDRFNYYGRLADLETRIRKARGIEVMFVPASPNS